MRRYKKPSIAGGLIDTENDSALFIHDAADEHITVGGDIRHRRQMFHHEWGKIPRACLEKYIINRINNCRKDIISSWYLLGERERRLLALYLYAGVRRGEALALKYGDIDRTRGLIRIERGVVFKDNQPIVGEPKTKAAKRFIPIMDKSLLEIIPDGAPEEYVIGGDKPITETCYKRMWDRIEKTINMHGATAHVLRHTYATMAAGTGIDPKTLQSIMGHADIQTTMNRYAHRRMDKIEEAKNTLRTMYM